MLTATRSPAVGPDAERGSKSPAVPLVTGLATCSPTLGRGFSGGGCTHQLADPVQVVQEVLHGFTLSRRKNTHGSAPAADPDLATRRSRQGHMNVTSPVRIGRRRDPGHLYTFKTQPNLNAVSLAETPTFKFRLFSNHSRGTRGTGGAPAPLTSQSLPCQGRTPDAPEPEPPFPGAVCADRGGLRRPRRLQTG